MNDINSLYLVASDSQVRVMAAGLDEAEQRLKIESRLRGWANTQHTLLRLNANNQQPYVHLRNLPDEKRIYYLSVPGAIGRMAYLLAAHPDFDDFEAALERAISTGIMGANQAKSEMRHELDGLPLQCAAMRAIGREFSIPLPKYVI